MTLTTSTAIFTVTEDGITAITVNGVERATGTWIAANADALFDEIPAQQLGSIIADGKTISETSTTGAIVRHNYEHAVITYYYTVNGADLDCRVDIQNTGSDTIKLLSFGPLTATFSGTIAEHPFTSDWNDAYLTASGLIVMYPNEQIQASGMFAADDTWGVGCAADLPIEDRSLWQVLSLFGVTRACTLHINTEIQAGQTKSFNMAWRANLTAGDAGDDATWQILMARWKSFNISRFGRGNYNITDERPLVQFTDFDASYIRGPGDANPNPYGYADDGGATVFRRFDKAAGITYWDENVLVACETYGIRGVIYWHLGGWNSRNVNYPVDFNVFPDDVQANVAALETAHVARDLLMGHGSRPSELLVTVDETTDTTKQLIRLSVEHIIDIVGRYQTLVARGFTELYVDTVIKSPAGTQIIEALRETVGPDVQLFIELPTDQTVPYAGCFANIIAGPDIQIWGRSYKFLMWLMDDQISIIAQWGSGGTDVDFVNYCYANNMAPMIRDWRVWDLGPQITTNNGTYLTSNVYPR